MKLSEVVNRINGNVDRFTTDLQYYIGGEHFDSNELVIFRRGILKENLNVLGFKFHFAFQERDVIFMARNPHLRKAGMVFFSGLCSDASYIVRTKDENVLSQEYLACLLQTDHFWEYCESHKVGSVNFAINYTTFANYEFDLPPIEKQREIAAKAWAAYRVKESYRQLLATTDDMLKAKFNDMFGKAEKNGTIADLVDHNITSVKKAFKPEGVISYIDISSVCAESNKVLGTTDYVVKQAPSRAQQCVKKGDILVSTTRPLNRNIAIVESDAVNLVASTGFCVLRPKEGYSDYVMAIVKSDEYTDAMCDKATGGVYPAVNNGDVLSYGVNIPSEKTLQEATSIIRQAEATKASLRQSIDAIDRVIRSLINQ